MDRAYLESIALLTDQSDQSDQSMKALPALYGCNALINYKLEITMKYENNPNFHIETLDSGVKVLYLHVAGKVNILKMAVLEELSATFVELKNDPTFIGLIFASDRPDMFIAGADIGEIDKLQEGFEFEAYNLTQRGKKILSMLSNMGAPTVAAIDGGCSGGGMELALWCKFIVITDNPKAEVRLPEAGLGLIPGFGGCVLAARRMNDLVAAAKFVATGASMSAQEAWKAGLVDKVVRKEDLIACAEQIVLTGKVSGVAPTTNALVSFAKTVKGLINSKTRKEAIASVLASSRKGRKVLMSKIVAETKRKGKGYISPAEAVKVLIKSIDMPLDKAMELESQVFAQMCCGHVSDPALPIKIRLTSGQISRNLIDVFLDKSRVKKSPDGVKAGEVKVVGVVGGAGAMGKEIGYVAAFSHAFETVVLIDVKQEYLDKALTDIGKLFDYQVKSGKLTAKAKAAKMSKFVTSTDYAALAPCDAIIEAVRENIKDKHEAYGKIDAAKANSTKPYWIFSNTSALGLSELAEGTAHPEWFAELHYFNPVSMMPLVECGKAAKTDAVTMATGIALASAMGKLVVPCHDKPGFIVNRILGPELIMIVWLLSYGVPPKDIDKAMLAAGFRIGAVELMDKVGLDIVTSVAESLYKAFGERLALPADGVNVLKALVSQGHLGMKSQKGFYLWNGDKPVFDAKAKCNVLNPVVLDAFPHLALGRDSDTDVLKRWSKEAILELLFGVMANEALRVLEDGVVDEPYMIDLAMIFGIGYPAFLGGPLRNTDREGVVTCHDLFMDIAKSGPETWRQNLLPCKLLEEHNASRENIYK